jgi:hypothetical protein
MSETLVSVVAGEDAEADDFTAADLHGRKTGDPRADAAEKIRRDKGFDVLAGRPHLELDARAAGHYDPAVGNEDRHGVVLAEPVHVGRRGETR